MKTNQSSSSVMATSPGAGVSGGGVWSDRKEAEERGKITAINIEKGNNYGIARIRTRWDSNVLWSFLVQIRKRLDSLAAVQPFFWSRRDVRAWSQQRGSHRKYEWLLQWVFWLDSLLVSHHDSRKELGATRKSQRLERKPAKLSRWKTATLLPLWRSDWRQFHPQVVAFIQANVNCDEDWRFHNDKLFMPDKLSSNGSSVSYQLTFIWGLEIFTKGWTYLY